MWRICVGFKAQGQGHDPNKGLHDEVGSSQSADLILIMPLTELFTWHKRFVRKFLES